MTLPRWFGRRNKNKDRERKGSTGGTNDDTSKRSSRTQDSPSLHSQATEIEYDSRPYFLPHGGDQNMYGGPLPPSLDEIAEAKRNLRKAVSMDMLGDNANAGNYQNIGQNYQNTGFGASYQNVFKASIQNRPLPAIKRSQISTVPEDELYEQFAVDIKPNHNLVVKPLHEGSSVSGVDSGVDESKNGSRQRVFLRRFKPKLSPNIFYSS